MQPLRLVVQRAARRLTPARIPEIAESAQSKAAARKAWQFPLHCVASVTARFPAKPLATRAVLMPHSETAPCRAVVFDLDGLMFNTEHLYRLVGGEVLRRRGKEYDEALFKAMMGRPARVALQIMIDWHGLDATVAQLEQENAEIFPPILDAQLAPMPGLADLLGALEAAGIPKAIATSSRRAFVANLLGRQGWLDRFAFWLTAEDVTNGKPDPEIYLSAAKRLELSPASVLVLEDSQTGCRAAVDAGTFAVAVPGDHSRDHEFPGAKFIAEGLADPRIRSALGLI
jgi:HAD superfamily hydrolase (TIGR01509 family)